MRNSMTAVLEQNASIPAGEFRTEPYEVAWAIEARWFVVAGRRDEGMAARLTAEISPDGLTWCELPGATAELGDAQMATLACEGFGGWLRLRVDASGDGGFDGVRIYLALKG